jgi:hypothetical protein
MLFGKIVAIYCENRDYEDYEEREVGSSERHYWWGEQNI